MNFSNFCLSRAIALLAILLLCTIFIFDFILIKNSFNLEPQCVLSRSPLKYVWDWLKHRLCIRWFKLNKFDGNRDFVFILRRDRFSSYRYESPNQSDWLWPDGPFLYCKICNIFISLFSSLIILWAYLFRLKQPLGTFQPTLGGSFAGADNRSRSEQIAFGHGY